ncbi:MAG: response regulator [Defluviitaleaceae bacterium]|nr:response regulator [Defluviitaleaceae bacterium]
MINKIKNTKRGWIFFVYTGLGTAVLLLISLIFLYLIINMTVRDIIYDRVLGIAQREKQLYAAEIDAWFMTAYGKVDTFANALSALSYPQDAREPGFRSLDQRDLDFIEIAERIVSENYYVSNAFIGFLDQSFINGSGLRPPPGAWTPESAAWFHAAIEAGEGVVIMTEPYWSTGPQTFTAGIATFLPDLHGVGAVVGISVTKDDILSKLAHDPALGEGYRVLVTNDGQFIYHSNPVISNNENIQYLRDIPGSAGNELLDYIRDGVAVATFYGPSLGSSYFVSAPLNTVGWTLFDIVPVSAVENPVEQSLNAIMFPLSALIIIIYLCALILFFSISRLREEKLAWERNLAEANSEAKSKFLARMSHEIRTPITTVLGVAEIQLQNPKLPAEMDRPFSKIQSSAKVLLNIVNDILDLSKIEAGKIELLNEEYAVASLITDIVSLHYTDSDDRGIGFYLHVDEKIPADLMGDFVRIEQIINNLLSNAFKYTEEGSVELSFSCGEVVDGVVDLIICVHDTGLGMSKKQRELLHESEYTRLHERNKRYIRGTGLGLPIVRNLLEIMDARMEMESSVGVGTSVVVTIPQRVCGSGIIGKESAARLQDMDETMVSSKHEFIADPMPYGKVLVVDDTESTLFVSVGFLKFYDLQIETCSDGYESLEKIKKGNMYDIIFMDEMMPGINGTETMRQMRNAGYTNPIIALTANALIGQKEMYIRNGFDGFISKPIIAKQLDIILKKFVRDTKPAKVIAAAAKRKTKRDMDQYSNEIAEKIKFDFARDHKNSFNKIVSALESDETETAHRMAHTIKSLAGLLKEPALAKAAESIEHSLQFAETPTAEQLSLLQSEMDRVIKNIDAPKIVLPQAMLFDRDAALALLEKLDPLIKSQDSDCHRFIDELRAIPETVVLCRQIERFDFRAAQKTLAVLKSVYDEV